MTRTETHAPFIDIRERYQDVVSARWPITVTPQLDELLSSWLHRLAYANGVPARAFVRVLGLTPGMWSARLDLKLSINLTDQLQQYADITSEQLAAMTMPDGLPKQLFLPLRKLHRRSGSTWLQFCPRCLATDTHPYFRREWRLATRLTCEIHKSRLRDRCTACTQPVAAFNQSALVPHHFCTCCGYDLRRASTIDLCPAVRKLDQCIHEIFGSNLSVETPIDNLLVRRLLEIPQLTGIRQRELLTGLSTSFRARCYEKLVCRLNERDVGRWHVDETGGAPTTQVTKESDRDLLIRMLSDALKPKQGRPTACGNRPIFDLTHFLMTAQQMSLISTGPKSRRRDATSIVCCQC
ncbi:TniQ family protein [Agrobacterium tumefaciens]|uniref:TniQ family protein n=1 Tax=Agrobacterium tumefaciens TaxID=358 RepID=UPI001FA97835|nr:TniQ family protein [Agrobacterium tumefaciens]UNZ54067.1 TniQ family protein [Agrobacterium tumefaciens]